MRTPARSGIAALIVALVVAAAVGATAAQDSPKTESPLAKNSCLTCHGDEEIMVGEFKRFLVRASDLAADIHWQKGLGCSDCHGGNASEVDFGKAHFKESGFRSIKSPADIPGFCGHCHSNAEYMRQHNPSPRTDQESIYWTSGHGHKLKNGDEKVATCVSCHGSHDVRAIDDLASRVYPTRVASTCAVCHSDAELMAGREYHGRPIGHDQKALWEKSVHAEAMLKKGDTSAPTCNDCHGNHGALPPEVGSVANACGTCHLKVSQLFNDTLMKHRFEKVDLPGCAACHGHHDIHSPSDEMLGIGDGAVCTRCHEKGNFGATFAGALAAIEMRSGLEKLKEQITTAKVQLDQAARLGMEVREPRFRLREANDALENARTLVHSFALDPMKQAIDAGLTVTSEIEQKAEQAVQEHTNRRIWLAMSLVPIFTVVGLLLLYIRTLPLPVEDSA